MLKNLKTSTVAALIALTLIPMANAKDGNNKAATPVKTADYGDKERAMTQKLQKEFPGLKVKGVSYFPSVDLFEVFTDTVYTPTFIDSKVSFMFNNGEVIDVKNKVNISKRNLLERDVNNKKKEDDFLKKLKNKHPSFKFIDAVYFPSLNIYEIRHENSAISEFTYVDEDITFIFNSGSLLDLEGQVNLTTINTNKREAPIKQDESFTSLPFNTAIKMTYGKSGVRSIAIFSDPRCPWCKKMDTDIMRNLKGVDLDVYYFMNPLNIAGHEDAPEIASKVLCAEDKVQAWKEWMLLGKKPENDGKACEAIVKEHVRIATEREYNSTPVILTDTGFLLPSSLSSHRFADFLQDVKYINQPHLVK